MQDFQATRKFLSKFVNILAKTQDLQLGYKLDSLFYGIPDFGNYVKQGLAKLTLEDVNRVIRQNLQAGNLKIVIVTSDAAKLRDAFVKDSISLSSTIPPNHSLCWTRIKLYRAIALDLLNAP